MFPYLEGVPDGALVDSLRTPQGVEAWGDEPQVTRLVSEASALLAVIAMRAEIADQAGSIMDAVALRMALKLLMAKVCASFFLEGKRSNRRGRRHGKVEGRNPDEG